jgi:hypothetical protein
MNDVKVMKYFFTALAVMAIAGFVTGLLAEISKTERYKACIEKYSHQVCSE